MREDKKDRILTAARDVFLRYGYKRVSMTDIAETAGISRPALYLLFKSKEDIFSGVFLKWVDDTIAEIEKEMPAFASLEKKLEHAFEIWVVRPFDIVNKSPEAKELIECNFGFAHDAQMKGYARFEATIEPVLSSLANKRPIQQDIDPKRVAHILASAMLGFKQTATSQAELRLMIKDLIILCLRSFF